MAHTLKCIYLNARSIAKTGACDSLNAYTSIHNTDIVMIAETWLYPQISDNELTLNDRHRVLRRDRGSKAGGVCTLVKKSLTFCEVDIEVEIEAVALDIYRIYRHTSFVFT